MKIMITGAAGQLGSMLQARLSAAHEVIPLTRNELDVSQLDEVQLAARQCKPDIIIQAAAYTNVDRAELETDTAYQVNAIGSRNVAIAAEEVHARLVYISTDYVFDGTKGKPYDEFDATNPLNIYGHSKRAGELLVSAFSRRCFILRTAWLYGLGEQHFVSKVLAAAQKHKQLRIVDDQVGSPTSVMELSLFIESLLRTDAYGLYHAANVGSCSRYEFALEIIKAAKLQGVDVLRAVTSDFPSAAQRPCFSALDDRMARLSGLPRMADWKTALHHHMK